MLKVPVDDPKSLCFRMCFNMEASLCPLSFAISDPSCWHCLLLTDLVSKTLFTILKHTMQLNLCNAIADSGSNNVLQYGLTVQESNLTYLEDSNLTGCAHRRGYHAYGELFLAPLRGIEPRSPSCSLVNSQGVSPCHHERNRNSRENCAFSLPLL